MDIPENVKYEFLLTLIGFVLLAFFIFFSYIKPIPEVSVKLLTANDLLIIFLALGGALSVIGLTEMYKKYRIESELLELSSILQKKDFIDKFEKLKLIESSESIDLNSFLKNDINNLIERKKSRK